MFGEPSAARVTSLASFFFQRPAERKNGWTLRQFPAVRSAWFYVFFFRRKKKYASKSGDLDVPGKMFVSRWRKFFGVEIKKKEISSG